MNVSELIGVVGAISGQQVIKNYDLIKEETAKGYNWMSTAGMYVGTAGIAAAMINQFQQGALYSFGAEPIVADKGFGYVSTSKGNRNLLQGVISGADNIYTPGQARGGLFSPMGVGSRLNVDSGVKSIFSNAGAKTSGVMTQNFLSTALPAGFTLYFAADAYANDGMTGLGKYLVADFLGNYYGTKVATNTFNVTKGGTNIKGNHFAEGRSLQRIAPIGFSGMLGRMLPTLGGIMGATIGMEVGAMIGSGVTSLMNTGGPNDSSGTVLGGLLGTIGGAMFGSAALSGIPAALIAGVGIAATSAVVNRNLDALKSGFDTKRGLNFAGQTAEYFTQNAVTMRERAVQSMHKSNMNARSAFGQEATLMHMNRDMFSQYKRPLR